MRIVFMGTPEAAVPTLNQLLTDGHEVVAVWTQPDRPSGRGNKLTASPVKQFALEHGLTVHQPAKIKTEEALETFKSHNADLAVVVAYGRILPETFLSTPKRGCVNVHFSLLPAYRGAAPVNWAIVNGEKETGVTTMFIEPSLDTGPILLQRSTPIGAEENASQLMERLSVTGAELLGETLRRFVELTPQPQDHDRATFAPILKREDGLIDWSISATEIERCVRGFQPWPNAHTRIDSKRFTIWSAEVLSMTHTGAPGEIGEIVEAQGDNLVVTCGGQSALRLNEVQPEAKRKMSVRDFLNGTHLKIGDRFGST
jgi:methionyl-tRNA formyltransferase